VLTHGFVVDGSGKKYSKSARNYVPPEQLINKHGAEVLRLWVAAEDYRDDIRFSEEILTRCVEAYRKLRNTARYILGNLYDFDPNRDALPDDEMLEIDRWALSECGRMVERSIKAYENFEFHAISQALNRFCSVEMSAFYLDILKDRLYAEKPSGRDRRSAQTALWRILDSMVRLMAPVFSFTAEEIWAAMPKLAESPDSIFLADMPSAFAAEEDLLGRWRRLMSVRSVVTKALEAARAKKFIGNSLAAGVSIECDDDTRAFLESFGPSLPDLFIVSGVSFGKAEGEYVEKSDEAGGIAVGVAAAEGAKCARCWKYSKSVGSFESHPAVCARCAAALS